MQWTSYAVYLITNISVINIYIIKLTMVCTVLTSLLVKAYSRIGENYSSRHLDEFADEG
jgi:ABC-type thiamin/hydroxymethylpyrimidine transport system permease subunit